jgi:hypothetical protein
MIGTRGMAAVGSIAALAAVWVGAATAATPAGLILEVVGATEPRLEALTEVQSGFMVKLAAGSRLAFVHYQSCRSVSMTGGTLLLRLTDYSVSGDGKVQSEQRRCPQRFVLTSGSSDEGASTVMLRGGASAVKKFSTRPIMLLTGPAAAGVAMAELRLDKLVVAKLPVSGQRAQLPDTAPALTPGRRYAVVLLPGGGGQPLGEELFTATETGTDPADRAVVLSLQ